MSLFQSQSPDAAFAAVCAVDTAVAVAAPLRTSAAAVIAVVAAVTAVAAAAFASAPADTQDGHQVIVVGVVV